MTVHILTCILSIVTDSALLSYNWNVERFSQADGTCLEFLVTRYFTVWVTWQWPPFHPCSADRNPKMEVEGHNHVGLIFLIWREWSRDRLCSVQRRWHVSTWDQITGDNIAVLQLMNVAEVEYPLCLKGLIIIDIINIIAGKLFSAPM